ncbi:MAG: ATP-binding cassette domain-containing protein, partial [Ilumatobacter sp.]
MTLVVRITRDIGPHLLDVDLEVATGERLVIVGPNGAGKTSLLRSIVGLDPAGDGRIALGSEVWHDSATGADTAVEARRLGFVPQHPT